MLAHTNRPDNSVPPSATPAGAADNGTTLRVHDPHEPPAESTVNGSPPVQVDPDAHRALVAFMRKHDGPVTVRQLQKRLWRKYRSREAAEADLDALAQAGWARWVTLTAENGKPVRAAELCGAAQPAPEPCPPVSEQRPPAASTDVPIAEFHAVTNEGGVGGTETEKDAPPISVSPLGTCVDAVSTPAVDAVSDTSGNLSLADVQQAAGEPPPGWDQRQANRVYVEFSATCRHLWQTEKTDAQAAAVDILHRGVQFMWFAHEPAFWECWYVLRSLLAGFDPNPKLLCMGCRRRSEASGHYVCPECMARAKAGVRDPFEDVDHQFLCMSCRQPGANRRNNLCEGCDRRQQELMGQLDNLPQAPPAPRGKCIGCGQPGSEGDFVCAGCLRDHRARARANAHAADGVTQGMPLDPCSAASPCLVCNEPAGCFRSRDGSECTCSRVKEGSVQEMEWQGQRYWLHPTPVCRNCGQPGVTLPLRLCDECMRNGPNLDDMDFSGESLDDLDDEPAAGPPDTDHVPRGHEPQEATGEQQAEQTPTQAPEPAVEPPSSPGGNPVPE